MGVRSDSGRIALGMWVVTLAFLFGVFVCWVWEALMQRDIARDEMGNRMNGNQSIKWIVDELRQQRQERIYLAEIHHMLRHVLHILQNVHPDALTPEQKAAIEAATSDLGTLNANLEASVKRQSEI